MQGTEHQDPAVPAVEVPVVIPAGVPVAPGAAADPVAPEAVVVPAVLAPAAGGPARAAVVPAATNKNKSVTFFLLLRLIIKLFCVSRPAAESMIPFSSTFRPGADLRILSLTKMDRGE